MDTFITTKVLELLVDMFFGRHPKSTSIQHNPDVNTTAPTTTSTTTVPAPTTPSTISNIHHPPANGVGLSSTPSPQCKKLFYPGAQISPWLQSTPPGKLVTAVEEVCTKFPPWKQRSLGQKPATY